MIFSLGSHRSWFGRMDGAFRGILFGGFLFLVAFPLQFWNEGRAVKRSKTLAEGQGIVLDNVPNDTVAPENDGKLVHMVGEATANGPLADDHYPITVENGLRLKRTVEMYQWVEHQNTIRKSKLGKREERTDDVSYTQKWSEEPIDSSDFLEGGKSVYGTGNPPMPIQTATITASPIQFGAFHLDKGLAQQLDNFTPLDISEQIEAWPAEERTRIHLDNGGLYIGDNPQSPQVGDLRIRFSAIMPTTISLIAQQTGDTFQPYHAAQAKGTIERLEIGSHTADQMFEQMVAENTATTWALRAAGLGMMTLGIGLIFAPLVVMADAIPFAGKIVGAGRWIIAFLMAVVCSTVTISIAWIFYRPLIGIALLIVAVVALYFIKRLMSQSPPSPTAQDPVPVV